MEASLGYTVQITVKTNSFMGILSCPVTYGGNVFSDVYRYGQRRDQVNTFSAVHEKDLAVT